MSAITFPPRSVLCPVDFSPASRTALQQAHVLAARFDASVSILHVEDPLLAQAARAAAVRVPRAEEELRRFAARAGAIPSKARRGPAFIVTSGEPAEEILKAAAAARADLIVMATHGLSGPRRLVFGSVTQKTLQFTTVPVLVTPAGRAKPLRAKTRIVAGIELGDRSADDVAALVSIARGFEAQLVLVHVVPRTHGPRWLSGVLKAREAERLSAARARLTALAAAVDVPVTSKVPIGDPAEQLAAAAAQSKASLIALILRPGHGLLGPHQGSITYRVLSSVRTPVLALPPLA
jgi:nucleotide-binding universal stress UspA family protein